MKRFVFRAVADAELPQSAEWYERQQDGLGLRFIDQVQKVLDNILESPERYPVALRDVREAIVSKFPYAVYYRVKSDRVVILAVFHCSRDPAQWQSRN
jgi:plasmid stabilization system protein ParE